MHIVLKQFWVLLLVGNPDPKITQPSHHCVFQVPDSRHMTEGKTRFRAFCHVFWTFQVKFVRTHCEQWNKLGGGMVQMIR